MLIKPVLEVADSSPEIKALRIAQEELGPVIVQKMKDHFDSLKTQTLLAALVGLNTAKDFFMDIPGGEQLAEIIGDMDPQNLAIKMSGSLTSFETWWPVFVGIMIGVVGKALLKMDKGAYSDELLGGGFVGGVAGFAYGFLFN